MKSSLRIDFYADVNKYNMRKVFALQTRVSNKPTLEA